jgi:hypothetical protein
MRLSCFVLLLAFGCSSKEPKAPPVERTAPVSEAPLNLDKPDQARVELDLAQVRGAVRNAQQVNGVIPKSIDELGLKLFYPGDLEYDASTGAVKSKTYPRF